MSTAPHSIDPHVLELDCTVEDTPRWRALIAAFENLLPAEQKWALKETIRRLRTLCSRQNVGEPRQQAQFDRIWGWLEECERRSRIRSVARCLAWIRHPWGRVGAIRKQSARHSIRFLRPSRSRVEMWKNCLIVKAIGPDACESVLRDVVRGMEAESLARIATRAQRAARVRRFPARAALAPVRGAALLWGATQAEWSSAREKGFERRARAIDAKNGVERRNLVPEQPAAPSKAAKTRRL